MGSRVHALDEPQPLGERLWERDEGEQAALHGREGGGVGPAYDHACIPHMHCSPNTMPGITHKCMLNMPACMCLVLSSLLLPDYATKDKLHKMLLLAIDNAQGFGLK
eukprot:364195-Chlamydomonas_euryale.AAC.5